MSDAAIAVNTPAMYLLSSTPVAGQKGLLINGEYFVPLKTVWPSAGTDTSDTTGGAVSDSYDCARELTYEQRMMLLAWATDNDYTYSVTTTASLIPAAFSQADAPDIGISAVTWSVETSDAVKLGEPVKTYTSDDGAQMQLSLTAAGLTKPVRDTYGSYECTASVTTYFYMPSMYAHIIYADDIRVQVELSDLTISTDDNNLPVATLTFSGSRTQPVTVSEGSDAEPVGSLTIAELAVSSNYDISVYIFPQYYGYNTGDFYYGSGQLLELVNHLRKCYDDSLTEIMPMFLVERTSDSALSTDLAGTYDFLNTTCVQTCEVAPGAYTALYEDYYINNRKNDDGSYKVYYSFAESYTTTVDDSKYTSDASTAWKSPTGSSCAVMKSGTYQATVVNTVGDSTGSSDTYKPNCDFNVCVTSYSGDVQTGVISGQLSVPLLYGYTDSPGTVKASFSTVGKPGSPVVRSLSTTDTPGHYKLTFIDSIYSSDSVTAVYDYRSQYLDFSSSDIEDYYNSDQVGVVNHVQLQLSKVQLTRTCTAYISISDSYSDLTEQQQAELGELLDIGTSMDEIQQAIDSSDAASGSNSSGVKWTCIKFNTGRCRWLNVQTGRFAGGML